MSGFCVSWCWKEIDYINVVRIIKDFSHPIYHICSGGSEIGEVRLDSRKIFIPDRYWRMGSCNVIGDMEHLPFRSSSAGSVVCDPPYDYNFTNSGLISELVRICKPRGRILFIAPWIPDDKAISVLKTELWNVGKNRPYHKIMTMFYKSNGQITDY